MRFIGTIEAKLDEKGRVFLPASFRRTLDNESKGEAKLVARKDAFENCIVLYPEQIWNARLDEMDAKLSAWSRNQRNVYRAFASQAEVLQLDKNGRILIPKRFAPLFGETRQLTFIGMGNTIEVWPGDTFNTHNGTDNDTPLMTDDALADALQILMA